MQGLQNLPELTSIVISDSFKLTNLYGLQNLPKLTSIEIYCADSLVSLKGLHNLPKLTHIDINNSSHLTNFNEHDLTDWLAQVQVSIDGKIINDNCTIHSLEQAVAAMSSADDTLSVTSTLPIPNCTIGTDLIDSNYQQI